MPRIPRRDMLKLMGATAAGGTAAAASGLLSPMSTLAQSTPTLGTRHGSRTDTATASPTGPRIAATASTVYRSYGGINFKVRDTSIGYTSGASAVQETSGPSLMHCRLDLPNGAVVTEASMWVLNNASSTDGFFTHFGPDGSNYVDYAFVTTSTASASVQRLDFSFAPLAIDTTSLDYVIYWAPGGADSSHLLYGARVGYIDQPGITLFPDPRRVVSGDVTPFTSGVTYGPIDATKKVGGALPSGVPAGASAMFAAVQSLSPGVLTLFPDLAADPGIANYSATGNLGTGLNMIYMMVPLSAAGKFKIHSYITGKVYVDAWGYVFPPG